MPLWVLITLLVGSDQLTKLAIRTSFAPGHSLPLIPGMLHLTYVQNTGAAFGLFQGFTGAFVLISLGVAAWVALELIRHRHQAVLTQSALALVLGGAIGNLIDRLWLGYVIDFIDVRVWPVFNVADSAISVGVALLVWQTLFPRRP